MTEDVFFTAPEGPLAGVQLNAGWTWALLVLGVAIVAVGGLLL